MQEAREVLREEGTYVDGRYGLRAHPVTVSGRMTLPYSDCL